MALHPVGLLFSQPPSDDGCRSFSRPTYLAISLYLSCSRIQGSSRTCPDFGISIRTTASSLFRSSRIGIPRTVRRAYDDITFDPIAPPCPKEI